MQIENGRERSRPFRLINPGHQHPAGAVAPKLDFADGKIEAGGGIIRGRAGCMDGAGPERANGQTCRARGGRNKPESVTPNESAIVQVCLPQDDLVAATIGSSQACAMRSSTNSSGRRPESDRSVSPCNPSLCANGFVDRTSSVAARPDIAESRFLLQAHGRAAMFLNEKPPSTLHCRWREIVMMTRRQFN